ncbi:MAG: DUF4397 domain-containing protein [Chloroflexi bacterium]|nr:DUF4397 domain-containing protein [Chloroflexota bacterium]
MKRQHWLLTGLLLAALAVALFAPLNGDRAQAQEGLARLRFLHAIPGAPEVDVYVDGALAVPGLPFRGVTPHVQLAEGSHDVSVLAAGADPTAAPLAQVPITLPAGLAFTVVLQGSADAAEAALYEDILDELEPGLARLTAINAIGDAPALDVLTTEGNPLLQGVSYGVQYGTINIPTGVQNLVTVPAGGSVDGAIATVGEVPLQSGTLFTLVAVGTLEGDTAPAALVVATPINSPAEAARVRVAHGSPDAPSVDVYANDLLIAPALDLGEITGHIPLPAGDYTFGLRPAGSPPSEAAVVTADVTLEAATPAITVVALGELSDQSLALEVFPDDVAGVTPEQARIAVVNAVPGSTATVSLTDPSGTALASDLGVGAQSDPVDVAAGEYMVSVNIQGIEEPVDVLVPAQIYNGGMYYSMLVYGGGVTEMPYDARVAGTEVEVTAVSLPGASDEAVVAVPPAEEIPAEETPVEETPAEVAPAEETPSEVVTEATPAGETPAEATAVSEVAQATAVPEVTEAPPAEAPAQETPVDTELVIDPTVTPGGEVVEAQPTPAPLTTQSPQPTAFVELNPGANLHCREYPRSDARSLGLIPSGATVIVLGRMGEPFVPETGEPTPEPTPVVETLEDLWLSVRWDTPDGGFLRCWVAAQYLRVEFNGRLLGSLETLLELPEEPFNLPGEAVNTSVAPPTPLYDATLATVELDPGVSLQLRRLPQTNAESLDLVPAGAQLEVLGYIEAPSEGMVGQPVNPNWLRVRYLKEDGSATIGWVSAQYISLSRQGRTVELAEIPLLEEAEAGFYEAPGQQPPQVPADQQNVTGVVILNPGANLNLRDRPDANAFVLSAIPSGAVLTINGRNVDATWVQVTYETDTGLMQGWVASQYLTITRGGQAVDLMTLPEIPLAPAESDIPGPVVATPEGAAPDPNATPDPALTPTIAAGG